MNKRDIVIGFIILLLVAGIIYFLRQPKTTPIETTPTPFNIEERIEDRFNTQIPEDTEKSELKDVSGGTSSGIAAKKFEAGKYFLTVLADLPDLPQDEFYQAWLVRGKAGDSNFSLIPLGKLQIAKGGYLLDFSAANDYSDYQSVVVSRETKLTNMPENKVLEGSF